jgi:hypothetical protein
MESIINLNEQESYNSDYQTFRLSNRFTIYKTKFKSQFSKDELIKRIEENKNLYISEKDKTDNSLLFFLECKEFMSIDDFAIDFCKKIYEYDCEYYAKSSWIYTQLKDFKMNWMHTHEYLMSSNLTDLKTDLTFVYYIQIPKEKYDNEGDIIFKTENDLLYKYTPQENDLLFFSGDLPHMANPTPNEEVNRIVYASNLNFDFNHRMNGNKKIKFKDFIYRNFLKLEKK